MADHWEKITFGLSDYFDVFGFDDGSSGAIGDVYISDAIRILNKHLKPFGLEVEDDRSGSHSHNPCRIVFNDLPEPVDEDGLTEPEVWEDRLNVYDQMRKEEGRLRRVTPAKNKVLSKLIVKAIAAAEKEFNELATSDISKVMNCQDKDLPLLVGHIKDEDALKILEWRLKS
jgi:hypothetical protein